MYEQQIQKDILFFMLYAAVTMLSLTACCYLMFRKGNAFAPDITTPTRLRRWTIAFLAIMTLGHLWYLPSYFLPPGNEQLMCNLLGGLFDSLTTIPFAIAILFTMLQDRKRSLWPIAVMMAPLVAGMVMCIATFNTDIMPMLLLYIQVVGIGLIIYMVHEVIRYGRWLRDNYADLEHKEMWQSFVALTVILVAFGIYVGGLRWPAYEVIIQVCDIIIICFILWRVETLSDLSSPQALSDTEEEDTESSEAMENGGLSQHIQDKIGLLLQKHCIDTQLYLQHDLTLMQLAKAIGTNRYYLSLYFSCQGITYNAYINNLRINHFVEIYRKAVASHHPFTAQQLAHDSGYRSYSTFSLAFKQRMGESVSGWVKKATSLQS